MFDLLAILIVLTALVSYLNHKFIRLPDAVGVMALALIVSLAIVLLGQFYPTLRDLAETFVERLNFGEAVLHGMLGFLLFAGALHVDLAELRTRAAPIFLLAVFGTIVSASIVGVVTWLALASLGLQVRLVYCLVFGALIAPTDPIAVLSLLRQAKVAKDLEIQIVGESLFNDGIGVVLFIGLLGVATGGEAFHFAHFAMLFLRQAVGGIVFGFAVGTVAFFMCRSIDNYRVEILISLALATGGFALAEKLDVSAPLAIVVAGLLMGNHGRTYAMSPITAERLDAFWELIDDILNGILFMVIGMEILLLDFSLIYLLAGAIAVVTVLLARLSTVALALLAVRSWSAFPSGSVGILTWAGLRGGISVALALSLPGQRSPLALPERDIIIWMTYVVVIFSILVQGLSVGPLARRLTRGPLIDRPVDSSGDA